MNVETYEVEETKNELGIMAADAEAQELIEKLGLSGQNSLLNQETCTRFPYRKMTKAERLVFALLFPERESLASYKDSIIPIRVLQVAAFVKDFKGAPCHDLKVWHCGSAKEDPLLVGHTSEYGGEFYLLARWGDALPSFDDLAEKARALWTAKAKSKIQNEIAKWNQDEANLESLATEAIRTGSVKSANNSYDLEQIV